MKKQKNRELKKRLLTVRKRVKEKQELSKKGQN